MNTLKNSLFSTLKVVIVGVVLAGGISYASTWVAPTQAPTGGNPDAPVNVGPTGQIKLGGLTLGAGNGVTQALTILNGQSGFGSSTIPSNLLVGVNGPVGATEYCDQNGQNCVPASSIGGGACSPSDTYDSGWVDMTNWPWDHNTGSHAYVAHTFTTNLGTTDTTVYYEFKSNADADAGVSYLDTENSINDIDTGYSPSAYWDDKTPNTIKFNEYQAGGVLPSESQYIRVVVKKIGC